MAVVTLISGWVDDFYIAAVKGALLTAIPDLQIVDLSHRLPSFNTGIPYAAYIVKHSYSYFPKGTIHILAVSSEFSESTPFLAIHYDDHYFIGTDNGIFGLLFTSPPAVIVRIKKYTDDPAPNYPALSVFAPTAIFLANGGGIEELGDLQKTYQQRGLPCATIDNSMITGTIIHINSFGNVITNVTIDDFQRVGKGRPFEILVQSTRYKITKINRYFHETSHGELLAVFNIAGYLEIAMNKGKVSNMLQLAIDSNVLIKFYDKK